MTLTPSLIKGALDACSDKAARSCRKCPFFRPGHSCRELLTWADYVKRGCMSIKMLEPDELEKVHERACQDLCDPLYLDLLKVAES